MARPDKVHSFTFYFLCGWYDAMSLAVQLRIVPSPPLQSSHHARTHACIVIIETQCPLSVINLWLHHPLWQQHVHNKLVMLLWQEQRLAATHVYNNISSPQHITTSGSCKNLIDRG